MSSEPGPAREASGVRRPQSAPAATQDNLPANTAQGAGTAREASGVRAAANQRHRDAQSCTSRKRTRAGANGMRTPRSPPDSCRSSLLAVAPTLTKPINLLPRSALAPTLTEIAVVSPNTGIEKGPGIGPSGAHARCLCRSPLPVDAPERPSEPMLPLLQPGSKCAHCVLVPRSSHCCWSPIGHASTLAC